MQSNIKAQLTVKGMQFNSHSGGSALLLFDVKIREFDSKLIKPRHGKDSAVRVSTIKYTQIIVMCMELRAIYLHMILMLSSINTVMRFLKLMYLTTPVI